jgi:hypothetical protein
VLALHILDHALEFALYLARIPGIELQQTPEMRHAVGIDFGEVKPHGMLRIINVTRTSLHDNLYLV